MVYQPKRGTYYRLKHGGEGHSVELSLGFILNFKFHFWELTLEGIIVFVCLFLIWNLRKT